MRQAGQAAPAMPPSAPPIVDALRACVGERQVSTTPPDRVAYARDLWPRSQLDRLAGEAPQRPAAVVWPADAAQVAEVVALCRQHRVPIVPFGAGSGVCGGTLPIHGGVVLDLKRLKAVRQLRPADGIVEVEAGCVGERLERWLNRQGLSLGHFPSSILCSTVGGWVATRSAGQCSSRYGKIEDMVVDLEVVGGDGVVRRTPRADAGGVDWNAIYVGSEGTLGVITAATLRVQRLPTAQAFRGWRVPNIEAGVEIMRRAMQAGLRPSVLRLYDPLDTLMVGSDGDRKAAKGPLHSLKQGLLGKGGSGRGLRWALGHPRLSNGAVRLIPPGCLLLAVSEGSAAEARATDDAIAAIARGVQAEDLGEGPARAWLAHRYAVSFKQSRIYAAGAFVDTFEVATTWGEVRGLYDAVKAAVGRHVLVMAHFSHAYPGGCSIYFTFAGAGPTPQVMRARYDAAWQAGLDTAVTRGAAIAHHHGVGLSRGRHMGAAHGEAQRWFGALKATLDPDGILNPGKVFSEAPP